MHLKSELVPHTHVHLKYMIYRNTGGGYAIPFHSTTFENFSSSSNRPGGTRLATHFNKHKHDGDDDDDDNVVVVSPVDFQIPHRIMLMSVGTLTKNRPTIAPQPTNCLFF